MMSAVSSVRMYSVVTEPLAYARHARLRQREGAVAPAVAVARPAQTGSCSMPAAQKRRSEGLLLAHSRRSGYPLQGNLQRMNLAVRRALGRCHAFGDGAAKTTLALGRSSRSRSRACRPSGTPPWSRLASGGTSAPRRSGARNPGSDSQVASVAAQPSTARRSGEVCPGMVAQPPASTNWRCL